MSSTFETLEHTLEMHGPARMTEELCRELRSKKDYHGLFYALILKDRLRLGLPPVHSGRFDDIPPDLQKPFDEAIREAARTVGQLYLDEGDIAAAWPFFRMISEPGPVAAAIELAKITEEEGEKLQQIISIALHEGAHPVKGFKLVVQRYGICNAITTFGQGAVQAPEAREQCLKLLVRTLYNELRERLAADLESRGLVVPRISQAGGGGAIAQMLLLLPPFTEEEFYHIDLSHLSSVVQFSIDLPVCEEMRLAQELCAYGMRLAPKFRNPGEPPFEDLYEDYHAFFSVLLGDNVEENLARFRAKAETANADETTLPGEVLVMLLHRLGRDAEAVQAFARYLGSVDARRLSCPSLPELCQITGDYGPLVEVSLRRGDLVNYAAGLLQGRTKPN
jgi:hypothetical protein